MRQRPNLRKYARGRPQRLQRLYCRVLNFCGRLALLALLALDGPRAPLVGLRVLGLQLLERGLLRLGASARLLLAPLLLGGGLRLLALGSRPPVAAEGHAEGLEQCERLLVASRGGGDRHVEAADLVDRAVVDLGEDDLLANADRVVAAAVEGARVEPPEVAD